MSLPAVNDPAALALAGGLAAAVLLLLLLAVLWWRRASGPVAIAELWVYPIKSCAGVRMDAALMQRGGLQWDREFAVMKPDGEVLTQKAHPTLARIRPSLQCAQQLQEGASVPAKPGPRAELIGITLASTTSSATVHVDLTDAGEAVPQTTVWGGNSEPLEAVRLPAADEWLSEQMGFACSLCRLTSRRPLRDTRLAPVSNDPKDSCRYQDGSPLTILSEASVAALNRKLGSATGVKPQRFRPNIIISGCSAFEETRWAALSVGADSVPIRMLMEAYRCTMVTIAQVAEANVADDAAGTRPAGHKVSKVMKSFLAREADTHGPLPRDNPNFAVFAAPGLDESTLQEGDLVQVVGTIASSGARSIYEHNERQSRYRWRLDEKRFWHTEGDK
jgi:uncharacterized protein YcbX